MKRTFLVRTDLLAIEPIGKAVRDHGVVRALIADRIGPDSAAIFAVPDMASDGSAINWYTEGLVRAARLEDVPDELKASVLARIEKLRADLDILATDLDSVRSSETRETAAMVRELSTLPDESFVFVVNGQPVLAAWSCAHVNGARYRVGYAVVERPVPPPGLVGNAASALVEEAARRGPWWLPWLWLVFLALVLAILFLLMRACALAPYIGWLGLPNHCATAQSASADLVRLQQISNDLENQVRVATKDCPEQAAAPAAAAIAELENRTGALQRGALEIALIWDSEDDLDLSVAFTCPQTQRNAMITFHQKQVSVCGGVLDADANAREITPNPAEHIVWVDANDIPPGPIEVTVNFYKDNTPASLNTPFQLAIQRQDEIPQFFRGVLMPGEKQVVTTLFNS